MVYIFKYRLSSAPEARNDGMGIVMHDIFAVRNDNSEWVVIPGYHQGVPVPADELGAVLDMSNGGAKIAAYKQLLVDHNGDQVNVLPRDWSVPGMQAYMDANDASALQAERANEYITVDLGLSYPVDFAL